MGGTETVEEVQDRDSALDGGAVRDRGQIHDFLYAGVGEHRETCLTAGIDIGMISEDAKGMGSNGTCGNINYSGKLLTGDLVHVGDHKKESL